MSEIKGFHYCLKNLSVQFIGYILIRGIPAALYKKEPLDFQEFEWWSVRGSNLHANPEHVEMKGGQHANVIKLR